MLGFSPISAAPISALATATPLPFYLEDDPFIYYFVRWW